MAEISAERRAELDRVCVAVISTGGVCGHRAGQHFGADGPCVAGHRSGEASTCPCVKFEGGNDG